jgi:hypothetical protein
MLGFPRRARLSLSDRNGHPRSARQREPPHLLSARLPFFYGWVVLACLCWPEQTKRPDLTGKRTKLERVGAILQAGQRVAPFRRWPCGLVPVTGIR